MGPLIFFPLLGLPIGILLAYLAKEELKPGKKYFITALNALTAIITGLFTYTFASYIIAIIVGAVLLVILEILKIEIPALSLAIFSIAAYTQQMTHIAVFCVYIVTGTLHYKETGKLTLLVLLYSAIAMFAVFFL